METNGTMELNEIIFRLLMSNSALDKVFIDLVISRLASLTYVAKQDDAFSLAFLMQKVENTIRNECNTASIPDGLIYIAADMVCGEFLMNKKQTNSLESFDIESAVKSVKIGDINVSFDDDGAELKLDKLFSYLMNYGKSEILCYRQIKW